METTRAQHPKSKFHPRLRLRSKLLLAFAAVACIVGITGGIGINNSRKIIEGIEAEEQHFRAVTVSDVEFCGMARRGEGHIMQYLMFKHKTDKEKFLSRCDSISDLFAKRKSSDNPQIQTVLERLAPDVELMRATGTQLIEACAADSASGLAFDFWRHQKTLDALYGCVDRLVAGGLELARIETSALNRQADINSGTDISLLIKAAQTAVCRYLIEGKEELREEYLAYDERVEANLARVNHQMQLPEARPFLDKIESEHKRAQAAAAQLMQVRQNDVVKTDGFKIERYEKSVKELHEAASNVRQLALDMTKVFADAEDARRAGIRAEAKAMQRNILILVGLALATALTLGYLISRSVSNPIMRLRNAARAIGDGKFDTRINVMRRDEVGELAAAFNQMARNLQEASEARDIAEREKAAHNAALNAINIELRRANADLEQLVFAVSHDLQEPLRKLHTFATFLVEDAGTSLSPAASDHARRIQNATLRLKTMLQHLLRLSRVGRTARPQPVLARTALDHALDNLRPEIQAENAQISAPREMPAVMADPVQLQEVFQHLIANAIKFHAPEKRPKVEISAVTQGDKAVFSVGDNGIGIEARFLSRLFGVFRRLRPKEEYEGDGIGLALCARITQRNGGRIWVESTPGKGSTFFFELPLAANANMAVNANMEGDEKWATYKAK